MRDRIDKHARTLYTAESVIAPRVRFTTLAECQAYIDACTRRLGQAPVAVVKGHNFATHSFACDAKRIELHADHYCDTILLHELAHILVQRSPVYDQHGPIYAATLLHLYERFLPTRAADLRHTYAKFGVHIDEAVRTDAIPLGKG